MSALSRTPPDCPPSRPPRAYRAPVCAAASRRSADPGVVARHPLPPPRHDRARIDGPEAAHAVEVGGQEVDHALPPQLELVAAGHGEGHHRDAGRGLVGAGLPGPETPGRPVRPTYSPVPAEQQRKRHHAAENRPAPRQVRELPRLQALDAPRPGRPASPWGSRRPLPWRWSTGSDWTHAVARMMTRPTRRRRTADGETHCGKAQGLGEDVGDLEDHPGRAEVDGEDLDDPGAFQAVQQGRSRHGWEDRERR